MPARKRRSSPPPRVDVSMKLLTAHKILISTAVVFFLFFAAWELRNYANNGEAWAVFRAVLYVLTSAGFAVYLKNLKRWYK